MGILSQILLHYLAILSVLDTFWGTHMTITLLYTTVIYLLIHCQCEISNTFVKNNCLYIGYYTQYFSLQKWFWMGVSVQFWPLGDVCNITVQFGLLYLDATGIWWTEARDGVKYPAYAGQFPPAIDQMFVSLQKSYLKN